MNRIGAALAGLCLAGTAAIAQDQAFIDNMKAIGATAGNLRKMEQKTGPEAVKHAERLGSAYENMVAFWRQKNAADAVKASEEGKAAAVILASAANEGDAAKAATAFKTLSGTCQSCHETHREKLAEGKYKLK